MSTPDAPDERDPRVAAWLEVEPLDEVTRARLVRTALAEDAAHGAGAAGERRARRILAMAAALLAVLVVGVLALVPRSDDGSTPTAFDAPATGDTTEDAGADRSEGGRAHASETSPDAAHAPDSAPSGATAPADAGRGPLGDISRLGDVSTRAALRAAAAPYASGGFRSAAARPSECAVVAARELGTPIAAGTATVDGDPATVVIVERTDGRRAAIAVVDATCAVGPTATLP